MVWRKDVVRELATRLGGTKRQVSVAPASAGHAVVALETSTCARVPWVVDLVVIGQRAHPKVVVVGVGGVGGVGGGVGSGMVKMGRIMLLVRCLRLRWLRRVGPERRHLSSRRMRSKRTGC